MATKLAPVLVSPLGQIEQIMRVFAQETALPL